MPVAKKYDLISEQDYLEGELLSDIRHEYIDGEIYAMVGAHKYHNQITGEMFRILANHLLGKPCQTYASDMKVKIDQSISLANIDGISPSRDARAIIFAHHPKWFII